MTPAIKRAQTRILVWRHDPVQFVRDQFGVEPDAWQVDFLLAYLDNTRVAAKACKGPGKTAVLAWCVWHFLVCHAHAKVVATSITGDNLRDGLWAELAKWQEKSEFLKAAFTWKAERITANDHPQTWFASARKWSQSADAAQQANALAGLHADNILFVIDEVGGVPDAVMAAAEAALANAGSEVNPNAIAKLLICGNPTHLSGPLYRACTKERHLWKLVEITGDPDSPKRSPRISVTWAREQIEKYGADNPWVLINVFGRFPPASLNALLGPDDMNTAIARHLPESAYAMSVRVLGVDVARQGDDRSVIAPRQGLVYFKPKVLRIPDTQQLAGVVAQAIQKFQPDAVFIDATGGMGYGVIDALVSWGYPVTGVQFAGKADDAQFVNKRAEMAFRLAHAIKKEGACLPPSDELIEEATAVKYLFKKDKFQIVEKDQIKEEIGRSPDLFDAYALTHAYPVAKRDPLAPFRKNVPGEYNPIERALAPGADNGVADYNPLG